MKPITCNIGETAESVADLDLIQEKEADPVSRAKKLQQDRPKDSTDELISKMTESLILQSSHMNKDELPWDKNKTQMDNEDSTGACAQKQKMDPEEMFSNEENIGLKVQALKIQKQEEELGKIMEAEKPPKDKKNSRACIIC